MARSAACTKTTSSWARMSSPVFAAGFATSSRPASPARRRHRAPTGRVQTDSSLRPDRASLSSDLALQIGLLGLRMLPGCLLVQFLVAGLVDIHLERLDRLRPGVLG